MAAYIVLQGPGISRSVVVAVIVVEVLVLVLVIVAVAVVVAVVVVVVAVVESRASTSAQLKSVNFQLPVKTPSFNWPRELPHLKPPWGRAWE